MNINLSLYFPNCSSNDNDDDDDDVDDEEKADDIFYNFVIFTSNYRKIKSFHLFFLLLFHKKTL